MNYGFRLVGSKWGKRNLVDIDSAYSAYQYCDPKAKINLESYLSAFTFGEDFKAHIDRFDTTKSFDGECWQNICGSISTVAT